MVKAAIITGNGINSDQELGKAFEMAGGQSTFIPITTLVENPRMLSDFHILAFPGGFSYGDHLGSGKVFGNLVKKNLRPSLDEFVASGKLIIGICNGFQVLVKMGLLPNLEGNWNKEVSLIHNDHGTFVDQWISLDYDPGSPCVWTKGMEEGDLPIRHGEGRFVVRDEEVFRSLKEKKLIPLHYQSNPNGSLENIAGICDPTGRILGLMPHPEAYTLKYHHPQWRRKKNLGPKGLVFFQNAVDFISKTFSI